MHFLQRGQQDLKQNVETQHTRVEDSIRKDHTVDATRIRIKLESDSQKKRDADIADSNDIAK